MPNCAVGLDSFFVPQFFVRWAIGQKINGRAASVALFELPEEMTKKLPRYPKIPAILVERLARDVNYPGVGELLLSDAIALCVRVAGEIAASLIVADSKGDAATGFYEKFGFISPPKLADRMFLPMQTAEKL